MATRIIAQKSIVIATPADVAGITTTTAAPATTTIADVPNSSVESCCTSAPATTAALLTHDDIKDEEITIEHTSSPEEDIEYLSEHEVVTSQFEDVMTQKRLRSSSNDLSVIGVLVPMDTSESSDEANGNMPCLSAIKNKVDIDQQVSDGQMTVVQGVDSHDRAPQFITVTVSAQDANQNYQVQYLDTEMYHSNSSQTQMTYPFCPVGEYQANGQSYYSTTAAGSNYAPGAAANTPTAHAASMPYLVPVDESLLLTTSSQSHSRDSSHSLTEVAFIHETQSTPQTPTSSTTTNSVSGGSMGTGGGGASPESEQNPLNANKIASATVKWLSRNYETADGVSLPRSTLYNHYMHHCNENKLEPVNAASFGKLIRSVFSGLRTRRLGTRGNSKYHYYGIRIKPDSTLNQPVMDENPSTSSGAADNNAVSSNACGGPSSSSSSGHRGQKKHGAKAETYEACIQYLGDGANVIPSLPNIKLDHTFNSELTLDDVETFRAMYREHCESFLEAVLNLEFGTVEFLWRDFWRVSDNNNMDECEEEEKYLSKIKLYLLCHCIEVERFVKEVDNQFYQNMVDVIIPDVLRSIPNTLTQAIRNFAKNLEIWLGESMIGVPERLMQIKTSAVSAFCQTLRRYTSLNHLAQAARAVLQNSSQISQMLSDLNRVDFHNVQEQAAWVCQCETSVVQRLENDFKTALQQQSTLEQWANWLQLVVNSALEEHRGKPNYDKVARQFLLKWSFYSSMVIRDLTLRSASSFGSFHLIRLLYDEYMFYLIEHKIAEAQQKTAIAVISDRMHNSMELAFDYQLEFISTDTQPGSAAKRMKHE